MDDKGLADQLMEIAAELGHSFQCEENLARGRAAVSSDVEQPGDEVIGRDAIPARID